MEKKVSTYTSDEKETMKKIDEFQSGLRGFLKEGEEIFSVEYYTKLKVGQKIEINSDFYIATVNGADGNRTGIYAKNSNNLIGYLDEEGNVEFVDDFLSHLDISLTIDDLRDMNAENLRAKIEELTPDKLEEELQKPTINEDGKEDEKSEDKDDKENKNDDEKEKQEIEETLSDEMGEDLDISYYREIKDNQMEEEFPDKFRGASEIGIAYSKSLNRFICVMKEGEEFKKVDGIEPSKPTRRTIISIDENGNRVERKSPHALLKTDDDRKELSITIGQYGYIEAGIVDRLPCNERIEHQVREDGQGEEGRTDVSIRKSLNREGKEVPHELAHNFEKNEDMGIETQNLEAIDGDEEFKLKDGTRTTLNEEAKKAKVSLGEFIKTFKEAGGSTIDEKLENTHNEFARQSGAPDLNRGARY